MTAEVDSDIARPLPLADELTRFFWEAAHEHRLEILRCRECGHFIHCPEPVCPRCSSTKLAPSPVTGRARSTATR